MKQKDDDDDLDDEIECLNDDVECDNMSFKNGSIGSGANTPGSAGSRVCNNSKCHHLTLSLVFLSLNVVSSLYM